MRLRLRSFLSLILLVAAAYGLYLVKWEVRELKRQNVMLEADILAEERAIKVLQTEWAYLNRPERLRTLAEEHLQLQLSEGHQMIDTLDFAAPEAVSDNAVQPVNYQRGAR